MNYTETDECKQEDTFEHTQPASVLRDFVEKCTVMVSALYQQYSPGASGLFANSKEVVIHGGQFVNQNCTKSDNDGFEMLQKHVSPAAIYDARYDDTLLTCHPGTRESVLKEIFDWVNQTSSDRETWILWLKGAAGSGKTTISRSVVKLCQENNIPVATYFFCHADTSRNLITTVVSTIVYQIIQLIPEAKFDITRTIDSNPLIFDQSFEYQLDMLVVKPLQKICGHISGVPWNLLLLLDGLDECTKSKDSQVLLVHAMAKYLAAQSSHIVILISSREERHLTMAFNTTTVDNLLHRLSLDNNYAPDHDIRRYLDDSFDEIKKTHPARNHIDRSWPTSPQINDILSESSGQFIYASVVVKFVASPYSHPPDQLKTILEGHNNQCNPLSTPFEELDKLYCHIFSQVDETAISLVLRILAYAIQNRISAVSLISYNLNISTTAIYTALAGLASIVECRDDQIVFLHASLPKFLLNSLRSKKYCINTVENQDTDQLDRKRRREGDDYASITRDSVKRLKRDARLTENGILTENNLQRNPRRQTGSERVSRKLRCHMDHPAENIHHFFALVPQRKSFFPTKH
ncbi:hypothetical protein HYPSUDRAFT_1044290 [Hypholoma sublateritium FD-334 SS-4]|uniref:Nephrocystin 3-like N-terminal domain-containing protein n=1 Tax=Hypholoma sublateritium (strain FD-334 SS-4) TaxID=945553 RepID=A0A0D2KR43_HYPSF|nr:hypothetical protein HYPSUDRAFT_1044290 [Hypholoma sublateritium FD-334 SS-4]